MRFIHLLMIMLVLQLVACQGTVIGDPSFSTASMTPFPSVTIFPSPTSNLVTTATLPVTTLIPTDSPTPAPTSEPIITILFTGVIVPARCVQAAIDEASNSDFIYDEVREIIQTADLAVGTFNATASDFPPHTGCVPTYVLTGSPENTDAMQRAGFDAMSVATNHIKDCGIMTCGDRAFFDTLDNIKRVGIHAVGAGRNLAEALQPVVLNIHGIRFGIISQGQIEQGGVYATIDQPGIAVLNKENIISAIQATQEVADVVIFMPHWGPEDMATPNGIQQNLAHQIVEAGADLVVGNHTHVVQGLQSIDGVPVFYGLGNFVFDQWRRQNQQGVILIVTFKGSQLIDYQLIPTHVEGNGVVHVAGEEEAKEILDRIQEASQYLR
jgi:hypothetical protein